MAKQDRPDEHRARRKDREASVVGSLSDMGVADLVQTLEMGRKSGVLHLKARTGARGTCWLRDGSVVDCELTGAPAGEEAFYRVLRWREGGFAIEFKPVEREERISLPTQALLLQGMRRIDDWGRLIDQLPPLDRRLEVDVARLGERLARLPDEVNTLLRLFDGRRTLAQVLEAAPRGDVAAAEDVARLVSDGILRELPGGAEPARLDEPSGAAPTPQLPEPGGVDWFAGPVGTAVAVAPVASWVPAPVGAPAASVRPEEAGWLEPPLAPPAVPAPTAHPRPAPRFSIPVPPPGSLPPPPSVAETLARYQVVPRPARPAAPALAPGAVPAARPAPEPRSGPLAASDAAPLAASDAAPLAATGAALLSPPIAAPEAPPPPEPPAPPSPAPERSPAAAQPLEAGSRVGPAVVHAPRAEPVRADPAAPAAGSAPGLARRLRGDSPAPRLEPASLPRHPEAPEALTREPSPRAPRRSVAPYAALGLLVLAVVAGGTALTRRPVLRSTHAPPVATAATPGAPASLEPSAAELAAAKSGRTGAALPRGVPTPAAGAPPSPAGAGTPPAAAAAPTAPGPAAAATATAAKQAPLAAATPVAIVAAGRPDTTRPQSTTAPGVEPDARKLLASADRKYAAGRYAEAIADYRRAIAQKPAPATHVALARALYDAHRSAEAMQELDGVLSDDPRNAGAWLLRGDIHQGEGRPAEAREAYRRFLELEPHGEQARTVRMILGREQQ
ncbi:MAG TPA: DUF4388 domain-containing protein [Anaeromyxobacteraceae bacterium]|nr:DUF4388 domain-containing protein [Anaeromyxobacteraceae bacterium]